MDARTILELAEQSTRTVRKRHDRWSWTREDFEDACQEAAAGIVRALRDYPGRSNGYYVRAGEQAATRYAFRRTSVRDASKLLDYAGAAPLEQRRGYHDGRPWSRELTEEETRRVWRLLYEARSKRGVRGAEAADRDTAILLLLSRGWTHALIAERMGLTRNHVHKYRQDIRRRLERIAAQGGVLC